MPGDHARAVERAFAAQAAAFEDPRFKAAFTDDLGWRFAGLELDGGPPTGLQPDDPDGKTWVSQRFGAVTAVRRV